jgi:predicted HicB family RNase H-like nuclease
VPASVSWAAPFEENQTMTTFPLRLPDDLKEKATAQAEQAGVSLNLYIALWLGRAGARSRVRRIASTDSQRG